MKTSSWNLMLAVLLSPLAVIIAAPLYLAYLWFQSVSRAPTLLEAQEVLPFFLAVVVIAGAASYAGVVTLGLGVHWLAQRFGVTAPWIYLAASAIPGVAYGLWHEEVYALSLIPGVYFGAVVAAAFWYLAVKRPASNNAMERSRGGAH
jgi:hypothetical protein